MRLFRSSFVLRFYRFALFLRSRKWKSAANPFPRLIWGIIPRVGEIHLRFFRQDFVTNYVTNWEMRILFPSYNFAYKEAHIALNIQPIFRVKYNDSKFHLVFFFLLLSYLQNLQNHSKSTNSFKDKEIDDWNLFSHSKVFDSFPTSFSFSFLNNRFNWRDREREISRIRIGKRKRIDRS